MGQNFLKFISSSTSPKQNSSVLPRHKFFPYNFISVMQMSLWGFWYRNNIHRKPFLLKVMGKSIIESCNLKLSNPCLICSLCLFSPVFFPHLPYSCLFHLLLLLTNDNSFSEIWWHYDTHVSNLLSCPFNLWIWTQRQGLNGNFSKFLLYFLIQKLVSIYKNQKFL